MSHFLKYFLPLLAIPALIAGILLHHNLHLGLFAISSISITTILISYTGHLSYDKSCVILIMCTMLGWYASWHEWQQFNNFYANVDNKIINITGTVTDYEECKHVRNKHRITLKMLYYTPDTETNTLQTALDGSLFMYVNHPSNQQLYAIGTNICVHHVFIKKPDSEFAYYLIREDVLGSIFINNDKIYAFASTPTWYKSVHTARQSIFKQIQQKLSPDHFALFSSLFLGNKIYNKNATDPIQDKFRIWGIAHIFARSGMHISIIIGILFCLLWLVPLPYSLKIFIISSITLIYNILSWSSVSFMRALIMCLFSNYSLIKRRSAHSLHLLSLTTVFVLLSHPINLFFLDFQLSFALTGALIWIYTRFSTR